MPPQHASGHSGPCSQQVGYSYSGLTPSRTRISQDLAEVLRAAVRRRAFQDYRDGAFVDERYVHHGAEAACLDRVNAGVAEPIAEVVEEVRGLLGRGRPDETGAPSFACVREQGELRDGQDGPSYVSDTAVHLPLFVGHDPNTSYFPGHPVLSRFAAFMSTATSPGSPPA